MSTVIVTGSGGLVGSAVVRRFAALGHTVVGVDNDMRGTLFGPDGSVKGSIDGLRLVSGYEHLEVDIRDRLGIHRLMERRGPDVTLVVHAASQPAHESGDPLLDWDVDATGTVNVLEYTRRYAPQATVVFLSTIKVYGQWPNLLPLVELATRYDLLPMLGDRTSQLGIDETMSIDHGAHSVFGAAKTAADVMAQEYGHTLGLRTVILRPGCLTGAAHAGVRQHGFLSYLMRCVATGTTYQVEGEGKQVRDQLHVDDVVSAIEAIWRDPPEPGSVFNLGGGRGTDVSVLEVLGMVQYVVRRVAKWEHVPARHGDHRWWITDTSKFRARYPQWKLTRSLDDIMTELAERWRT